MKWFTIEELTRSSTAERLHIDNKPSEAVVGNLKRLAEQTLDPARALLGSPIFVNSGYRCPQLNKAVGGVPNSFHLQGRAADLDTRNGRNRELYEILQALPHVELIWERGGAWIHVAL